MKEIVVAIDFSKGSIHALEYAINIAKKINANISMVWVNNFITPETVFSPAPIGNQNRIEVKNHFENLLKKYKKKLVPGKLKYKLRKGKVYHEIANQVKQDNAYLIIAGTHGVSGFEKYWIGSNAYRIVTYSPCPVITLRNEFKFHNSIKKILFPIDNTLESKQKFPFTADLASYFNAEIHVLLLYSTSLKSVQRKIDSSAIQAIKHFEDNKLKYILERKKTDNITKTALDYAEKQNIDLIAIMTEQESTAANIFLGPLAEKMVSHSHIPILSIRAQKIINN